MHLKALASYFTYSQKKTHKKKQKKLTLCKKETLTFKTEKLKKQTLQV